jgi:hypothetical protein
VSTAYTAYTPTGVPAQAWATNAPPSPTRTVYGAERYDAAFQGSAAMTYDRAFEHTLRVLDDLVNAASDTAQS